MFVANRRADRARALAERFGGTVGSLDQLPERLDDADIVVASTSSPHVIVGAEELELVMEARGGRPLVLIDIAVPRDIDHACAEIPGVTLFDMDDLQAVVARNLQVREGERELADAVVEDEINRFSALDGPAGRDAHDRRPARARRGDRRAGAVRERRPLGVRVRARPRADRRDRPRRHAAAAARADRPAQGPRDTPAAMAGSPILRELFGLDEVADEAAAPNAAAAEPDDGTSADVHPLRRRP